MSSSARPPSHRSPVDLGIIVVGLAILALDQLAKRQVVLGLGPGAPQNSVEVIGSYVRLAYTTNTGAAFGLFPERTVVFTVVALLAIPLLVFSRFFICVDSLLVRFCLGLLLGGTLGNLVDRLRLGYVVDFIDVGIEQARWPSFNVADSAFVVGVAVLALYMLLWAPEEVDRSEAEPTGQAGSPEDRPGRHPIT